MLASVIVPTYNRLNILKKTVSSLLHQSIPYSAYEIIVVDDGSEDATSEFIADLARSTGTLQYIRHEQNLGRVAARNDGIRAATGEIIIFIDDDNVPEFNFIEEHLRCYDDNAGSKLALTGNARYAEDVVGNSNFARYMQSRYLGSRLKTKRPGLDSHDLPARCFGTLNCSARRQDLLDVGMFDTSFRYYGCEDEYLGYRLKEAGVRIIFAENAKTLHCDDITLTRYKLKTTEAAQYGINVLLVKSPDYLESTMYRFLTPLSVTTDSLTRLLAKSTLRLLLNRPLICLIEKWAQYTDKRSSAYCPYIFRSLIAGWVLQGMNVKHSHGSFVSYGH